MHYLYMKNILLNLLNIVLGLIFITSSSVIAEPVLDPAIAIAVQKQDSQTYTLIQEKIAITTTTIVVKPVYKWGECDWLPAMALKAGWPVDQLGQLKQVALRESGCCPNRRGGDTVDKECNLTGVSEWNHRSDTSLLQINGINYDPTRNPTAPICLQMKICTQEPLFDAYTNLKAGKLLYDYWEKAAGNGWIPWDICHRNKTCK